MQNIGIWSISELRQDAPDLDYGLFKLPIPEDRASSVLPPTASVRDFYGH